MCGIMSLFGAWQLGRRGRREAVQVLERQVIHERAVGVVNRLQARVGILRDESLGLCRCVLPEYPGRRSLELRLVRQKPGPAPPSLFSR